MGRSSSHQTKPLLGQTHPGQKSRSEPVLCRRRSYACHSESALGTAVLPAVGLNELRSGLCDMEKLVFSIVVIAGCGRLAWQLFTPRASLAPLFLCLIFGPTLGLLEVGQLSVLVLMGITLFLVEVQGRRDWIAGAMLLLVCIKPHISFLFLLAVLLWAIYFRRWAIIWGAILAVLISSLIVCALNPNVFGQYIGRRMIWGE